ncbi:MAG TPA: glycine zipper 2TM domain-containing protein [Rubrivivax sp.]|nr:glycine zipper 2TM domain-containing protein [Rubrivivax sp.]
MDFTLVGTPGGRATVRMVGVQPRFRLTETRTGTYTGSYTVHPNDQLDPKDANVARLRVGERSTSTTLEKAIGVNRLNKLALAQPCSDCATVLAVNRVEVEGDGRYIGGAVAGGLLGAVLGSQVGSGRTAAQVAGVLGGAVLGREVQKSTQDKEDHFEIVLHMRDDGSQRMVSYDDAPAFKVGDKVLLRDGGLTLDR